MPAIPGESRDTHTTKSPVQQLGEPFDDEAAPHDDTTLKFTGRMSVTDEDAGGDPYNHTGRFRRVIR